MYMGADEMRTGILIGFCGHYGLHRVRNHERTRCCAQLSSLVDYGAKILAEKNPLLKKALTHEARERYAAGDLPVTTGRVPPSFPDNWGREEKPSILNPVDMPKPKAADGPTALFYLHSLAHVELNAINLCWDTLVRFSSESKMPEAYYRELLEVADDESRHYGWLHQRLIDLGSSYGEFPAHDQIWKGAMATNDKLVERLAIGQLVQEARGLDAAPRVAEKLNSWNDHKSSAIVARIGEEEVNHVKMGVRWYLYLCDQGNISDPIEYFHKIALRSGNYGAFSPPFNSQRRTEAGLTPEWYEPVSEVVREILNQRKKLEKDNQKKTSVDRSSS